jgi:hypothetical protein
VEKAGSVRLLLGAEPSPPPVRPERRLGEPRGERFEAKLTCEALDAKHPDYHFDALFE